MKESQFNVFYQFAGCFVPHGLLSMKGLSAGAKLCYAALAQQANARGTAQLNLPLLAASVGELERDAVRYLVELEEVDLIESSRGNVNKEDVRISFPRHPWLTQNTESAQATIAGHAAHATVETQPRLFAIESAFPQTTTEGRALAAKKSAPSPRSNKEETLVRTPALAPFLRGLRQVRHVPKGGAGKTRHLRPAGAGGVAPPHWESGRRNIGLAR